MGFGIAVRKVVQLLGKCTTIFKKLYGRHVWTPLTYSEVQRTDGARVFGAAKHFLAALSSSVAHSFGNVGRVGSMEGRKVQSTVIIRVRNIAGELGECEFGLQICLEAKLTTVRGCTLEKIL